MDALVIADTVLLASVLLLVGGLLRSHAEIISRLDRRPASTDIERIDPRIPAPQEARPASGDNPAPDIQGVTLDGDVVRKAMRPGESSVLLAFLTGGCATCESFWEAFSDPKSHLPGVARPIVITKDPDYESRSHLRKLIRGPVEVVMSSSAWEDYEVPNYPYLVLVDGQTAEVQGMGSSASWGQLESLITDALEDLALATAPATASGEEPSGDVRTLRRAERVGQREQRINAELASAGIDDGHPSLYAGAFENAPGEDDEG